MLTQEKIEGWATAVTRPQNRVKVTIEIEGHGSIEFYVGKVEFTKKLGAPFIVSIGDAVPIETDTVYDIELAEAEEEITSDITITKTETE